MIFLNALWSLLWRVMLVLLVNSLVNIGLARLAYATFEQTEFSVLLRWTLKFLPALLCFLALGIFTTPGKLGRFAFPPQDDAAVWQKNYYLLAVTAAFVTVSFGYLAITGETLLLAHLIKLLPAPLFIVVIVFCAVRLSQARRKAVK
ncbi:hypothetical protein [Allorhizobium taibaishanense]|uniref:Uncharacterized protein n=1 Tax=Allorhizobium taibaishanense TaxID=887144 RepID=A0A1Q9A470_9HYPH|nr:hypothetical protein [Allorhizobium taibaishanense]MBB4006386.1 hypothetical protein [Allorhizobium taibaishanense]OLP49336.1 hypothetical protein BJF91_20005 [Allorhizobium taibaishanense]